MRFLGRLSQLPPRLATGAYILNSGLSKRNADEEAAAGMHGMAAGTYPFLAGIEPKQFAKYLSTAEIALGTALLVPIVPAAVAGAGLAAFAGGLLGLYLKTPGLREEGSIRPTQAGTPIAKDVWMFGIGAGLVLESLTSRKK
ncbi:hypothetical protein [Cryptosporangium phraense]|uniref:DoxX family membrane protein n=1 Tax=Cryptosporangium phraense TaxID=2593070 RepID=A0A545AHV4_9ACTN|nr:hypothetical protein [Cryptosporangium phraense]TQS40904.1 hypothetical protein FL583_32265 [Cryptosporangium phraense]